MLAAAPSPASATITDYSSYTYTWTDAQGVQHTSNLAEVATSIPQMKAMIYKVYSDKTIPGLKEVRYKRTTTSSGGYNYPTHAVEYTPGQGKTMLDEQFGVNYNVTGLGWEDYGFGYTSSYTPVTYTPNKNGYTALLVQLKDDYDDASEFITGINSLGNPYAENQQYHNVRSMDRTWAHIKSIEMIPVSKVINSAQYVDGQKWGVAFNITKPLNKFFVMLKGNAGNKALYQHAPFYHMFEQLSPGHGEAFGEQNAFFDMEAGHAYPVSHNCLGVTTWGHAMQMLGTTFNPSDPARGGNVIVFVPYNRFFGEANQPNSSGNWTTSQFNYYDSYYSPYFFIYNIALDQPTAQRQGNVVNVALKWKSSFKDVTNGVSPEEYKIMHRVNGGAWEPVPMLKVTSSQDGTTVGATYVVRGTDGTVEVTVQEPMQSENLVIEYQIVGRLQNSDFAWVESNQRPIDLGGLSFSQQLSLNIEAAPISNYNLDAQTNEYAHQVSIFSAGHEAYPHPLTRAHIAATGTQLTLVRFDSTVDDYTVPTGDGRVTVGTYTITPDASLNADGNYTYTVTDAEGNTVTSLYSVAGDDADSNPLLNAADADHLFMVTDRFDTSVAQAPDSHYHIYRVFATNAVGVTDNVYSNVVPIYNHGVSGHGAFVTYTAEEVANDTDHHLPLSTPALDVTLTYDPDINYIMLVNSEDGQILGRINRDASSGSYSFFAVTDNAQAFDEVLPSTASGFTGTVRIPLGKYISSLDGPLALIAFAGENSYGTPLVNIPVNGEYRMDLVDRTTGMQYDAASQRLTVTTQWQWQPGTHLANAPAHIIRAWSDREGSAPFVNATIGTQANAPTVGAGTEAFSYDAQDGTVHSTHIIADTPAPTPQQDLIVFYDVRRYSADPYNTSEAPAYVISGGRGGWGLKYDGGTTGLESLETDADIWPLVTSDVVNVNGQGQVSVFNLAGSLVARAAVDGTATLSLGHLPQGVYIVALNGHRAKVLKR